MAKKKSVSKMDQDESSHDLDFEQALQEVEQIVSRLEGGQLGLTESLQQYEVGIKQLKQCHQLLDAAEQRVSLLAGFDADGNPVLESLGDAARNRQGASLPKSSGGSAGRASGQSDDTADDTSGLF